MVSGCEQLDAVTFYLHIGPEKTGSSARQRHLNRNRVRLLKDAGILYPESQRLPDQASEAHTRLFESLSSGQGVNETTEDLRREIRQSCAKAAIVSHEGLGYLYSLRPVAIAELRRHLRGSAVKIVVYPRRQDDLAISVFNQSLKPAVFAPKIGRARPSSLGELQQLLWRADYWSMLKCWASVFGETSIIVRPYERSQLLVGDVRADFLNVVGCEAAVPPSPDESNFNRSLHSVAADFAVFANRGMRRYIPAPLWGKYRETICAYNRALREELTESLVRRRNLHTPQLCIQSRDGRSWRRTRRATRG